MSLSFGILRNTALWCRAIQRVCEFGGKLRKHLVARHLKVFRNLIDSIGSERVGNLIGSNWLVLTGANP
jgi:hypothetical protein